MIARSALPLCPWPGPQREGPSGCARRRGAHGRDRCGRRRATAAIGWVGVSELRGRAGGLGPGSGPDAAGAVRAGVLGAASFAVHRVSGDARVVAGVGVGPAGGCGERDRGGAGGEGCRARVDQRGLAALPPARSGSCAARSRWRWWSRPRGDHGASVGAPAVWFVQRASGAAVVQRQRWVGTCSPVVGTCAGNGGPDEGQRAELRALGDRSRGQFTLWLSVC